MKIIVDADACPVKEIIEKIAKEFKLKVEMYVNTSHEINSDYSTIVVVDKGKDRVDMEIVNCVSKKDIVVTQDYGLAAFCIAKKALAINHFGLVYTDDNIDGLLAKRFLNAKSRKQKIKTINPKKRTAEADKIFYEALVNLVKTNLQ